MKKNKTNSSLEWEVISAVIILYLLITGTLLAIHYTQSPIPQLPAAAAAKGNTHGR